ncbi:MAG: hypothetical protein Q9160_006650 [Pyrenula sp. 1 TL-2023]
MATTSTPQFTLHPSSTSPASPSPSTSSPTYAPPPLTFLPGTWHVTHSTLPMWKSKSNVRITYTPLSPSPNQTPSSSPPKLDDLVQYTSGNPSPTSPNTKAKEKTVHGTSTPTPGKPGQYDWRGKGWLVIAGSHWEVLGWGTTATEAGEVDWAVTYFAKTLFTPAGVDVYQRRAAKAEGGEEGQGGGKGGLLGEREIQGLREAMRRLGEEGGDAEVGRLEKLLFEVRRGGVREEGEGGR